MRCHKCESENIREARFCEKCGSDLKSHTDGEARQARSFRMPAQAQKIGTAVVVLGVVVFGGLFIKSRLESGNAMEIDSLRALSVENDALEKEMTVVFSGRSSSKEDIDAVLKKTESYVDRYSVVAKAFAQYAESVSLTNDVGLKDFVEKKALVDELGPHEGDCDVISLSASALVPTDSLDAKQKAEFFSLMTRYCADSEPLRNIIVKKNTKPVEGTYREEKSQDIPIGYSIVSQEPVNGERGMVSVSINGKEKGSRDIVSKDSIEGVKLMGAGKTEDIGKKVDAKLQEILLLWRDQKFSASDILPFLDEKNKKKATDWESAYKKTVFNWARFDKLKSSANQIEFKDTESNKDFPITAYIPVQDTYYVGYGKPQIPFFYDVKTNAWVSSNATIAELFALVEGQSLFAMDISPDTFRYKKTDSCKSGWFFDVDKSIKITKVSIDGYATFKYSLEGGYTRKETVVVEGMNDDPIQGNKILPSDVISYINKEKKTRFIGKEFVASSGSCTSNPDIKFTFFKDDSGKAQTDDDEKKDDADVSRVDE